MRFSRARYVTLCQQSLVTAAVLAVAVSAAGVKTLDIVPQPGQTADLGAGVPGAQPRQALGQDAEPPAKTPVDVAPVTPKVREVKVSGISAKASKTARPTPPSARQAPPKAHEHEGAHSTEEPAEPKELVALSEPEPVRGYATVGVTWKHGTNYCRRPDRRDGAHRGERHVVALDPRRPTTTSTVRTPAPTEENAGRERPGTDALVVGDVDRVQMRAETTDGSTPPDLKLAVIDPGTGAMTKEAPAIDTAKLDSPRAAGESSAGGPQALSVPDTGSEAGSDVQDTVALSAMKTAPRPKIYTRSQWGANERLRERGSPDYGTVKAGFIHHTVNSNSYSSSQVPSLLRGIYAYHTQSRGWSDIGYNFLVDRFGRIWEGRYGGVTRAVVGAHTLGYNEYSFALSAIGNFDIKSPPTAVTSAYAKLFAWKLSLYNIRADNPRVYVKNRYFRAISGHRDAGQTACPGRYLYAKLPAIRTAAQSIQNKAQSHGSTTKPTITPFTSPTQTPLAAKAQPRTMTFPSTRNLSGAAYPDLALKDAAGRVSILPTGGQLRYSLAGLHERQLAPDEPRQWRRRRHRGRHRRRRRPLAGPGQVARLHRDRGRACAHHGDRTNCRIPLGRVGGCSKGLGRRRSERRHHENRRQQSTMAGTRSRQRKVRGAAPVPRQTLGWVHVDRCHRRPRPRRRARPGRAEQEWSPVRHSRDQEGRPGLRQERAGRRDQLHGHRWIW